MKQTEESLTDSVISLLSVNVKFLKYSVANCEKMLIKLMILLCLVASIRGRSIEEMSENRKPAGSTTYDQRQTGKYNLHVNIKDVQFFSLSDSLASIGDYGDYGDYPGDEGFGDTDYDVAHLTVNPVFAFLGSQKPTTSKPTIEPTTPKPTTEKRPIETSSVASASESTSIGAIKETTTAGPIQQDFEIKQDKRDAIDYEEIPVEVQYYRGNQQKLQANGKQANRFHRRQPSVQIIDGLGRANNVKIIENEEPTVVRMCRSGEFRDNLGRCRVRTRRGAPAL